jgi:hypothetical protein
LNSMLEGSSANLGLTLRRTGSRAAFVSRPEKTRSRHWFTIGIKRRCVGASCRVVTNEKSQGVLKSWVADRRRVLPHTDVYAPHVRINTNTNRNNKPPASRFANSVKPHLPNPPQHAFGPPTFDLQVAAKSTIFWLLTTFVAICSDFSQVSTSIERSSTSVTVV